MARIISLISMEDMQSFQVEESFAVQSLRIKYYVESNRNNIHLAVHTSALVKILDYLRRNNACADETVVTHEDIIAWDEEFEKLCTITPDEMILHCKCHVDAATNGTLATIDEVADEDLKAFNANFVNVDFDNLLNLYLAANYLKIRRLEDLTCKAVIEKFRELDDAPEELRRQIFGP